MLVKWGEVTQLCPTLCDPMDCHLPGSSVHGILQARILEWVAISFCRRSFQPRDWTQVSHIIGRCFTIWATKEVNVGNIDFVDYSSKQLTLLFSEALMCVLFLKDTDSLFEHELGALNMAALLRKEERANLLSNLGPCCKALCFRRDSAIRKQLVKNEKVLLFP